MIRFRNKKQNSIPKHDLERNFYFNAFKNSLNISAIFSCLEGNGFFLEEINESS